MDTYDISSYDYELPEELIAYHPVEKRGMSRMLVLDKGQNNMQDKQISDILDYINKDVIVVANNTKVMPARLIGEKVPSGGKADVVLLAEAEEQDGLFIWNALIKAHRLRPGQRLKFKSLEAVFLGDGKIGFGKKITPELLDEIGEMPLPPYIKRPPNPSDRETYQTVFAKENGSVAAPTAGLHFTDELIARIREKADRFIEVTLHVGYGTFAPVKNKDIRQHKMHKEYFSAKAEDIEYILKNRRKKVLAIGTTSVRVLETIAGLPIGQQNSPEDGLYNGWTDIFIYPPYEFKLVDMLLTNFHLPKSTLFMLVSAFAGTDTIKLAYQYAISQKYRFFSYGDAMLIK